MAHVKEEYANQAQATSSNASLLESLRSLQVMLKYEAESWYKSDNVKIAQKINAYDVVIETLIRLAEQKEFEVFIMVFKEEKITINGIRDCFRNSKSDGQYMKRKRNAANRIFVNVCGKVLGLLKVEYWMKKVNDKSVNIDEMRTYFQAQYDDAAKDIDDDEEAKAKEMFA